MLGRRKNSKLRKLLSAIASSAGGGKQGNRANFKANPKPSPNPNPKRRHKAVEQQVGRLPSRGAVLAPGESGAYARGALYGAATRRGPGLVDVGSESTHQGARIAAYGLCSALAERTSGPTITQAPSPSLAIPEPGLSGPALAAVIQQALSCGTVAGLERWEGPTVSVMTRWGEVAEVEYTCDGRSLVFILSARDDTRATFVRGHAYELVYYSDDLAPEEHEALYDRDAEAIESFARWFRSWDRSDDAA